MSRRIEQINKTIQKELGRAILQEIKLPPDALATITKVQVSSDLSQVKVWISILPEEKRNRVIMILQKARSRLQSSLNRRLKLKRIPKIKFILDVSEEKAERINRLLDKIIDEA